MSFLSRFIPDRFTMYLIVTIIIASFLPVHGQGVAVMSWITNIAIAALFFLHGARLSREAIIAGLTHWRLHIVIFFATFVMFPIAGLLLRPVLEPLVTPTLYLGVLYLCVLPATVQSAIAFTSIARGNIAAAVCSASGSSIIGIVLTPLLVSAVLSETGGSVPPISFDAIGKITLQLFVPFVIGHLLRPLIGQWVKENAKLLKVVDQGSILLVVYSAFSEAMNEGLWQNTPLSALIAIVFICIIILAIALAGTTLLGKLFKFNLGDRITLVFCGSKKSLASGLPMAQVIFAGYAVGGIVLPLMIFHQIQLMVCAVIAAKLAVNNEPRGNEHLDH